jgi:NADH:ubiquinone oxidoreductase subunit F (NADH-binding)
VSDERSATALQSLLATAVELERFPIEVVMVAHSYVAGEETAAVRYINGGPALPTTKPPRPFEAG